MKALQIDNMSAGSTVLPDLAFSDWLTPSASSDAHQWKQQLRKGIPKVCLLGLLLALGLARGNMYCAPV